MSLIYRHLDAAAATPLVDQLVAVYLDVYGDDVRRDQVFYGEGRFRRQITGASDGPAMGSGHGRVSIPQLTGHLE